jgi:hypothetical protein
MKRLPTISVRGDTYRVLLLAARAQGVTIGSLIAPVVDRVCAERPGKRRRRRPSRPN